MKLGFLTILSLSLTSLVYTQNEVIETPIHFGQFFNNPLVNIAKEGAYSEAEAFIGSKRNFGSFGKVSTTFFSANFRLGENNGSHNSLGIYFYNDKEGEFIRRKRAYFSIVRHQKISSNWIFSGAISAGAHFFSVKLNEVTGGISETSFDGSAGVMFHSFKTKIGLSVNQYANSIFQPLVQEIILKRHYYLYGEQRFFIKKDINLTSTLYTKYIDDNLINIGFANRLFLKNIHIGASYEYKEGYYAFFGINNLQLNKRSKLFFDIDFAYFIPSNTNIKQNTNSLELILKYSLDKKNDERGYFR